MRGRGPTRFGAPQDSPAGAQVRQGPVQRQAVAQVGVVAVVLELFQGDPSVLGAQVLAPVSEEGGVGERFGGVVFQFWWSFYERQRQKETISDFHSTGSKDLLFYKE